MASILADLLLQLVKATPSTSPSIASRTRGGRGRHFQGVDHESCM